MKRKLEEPVELGSKQAGSSPAIKPTVPCKEAMGSSLPNTAGKADEHLMIA